MLTVTAKLLVSRHRQHRYGNLAGTFLLGYFNAH